MMAMMNEVAAASNERLLSIINNHQSNNPSQISTSFMSRQSSVHGLSASNNNNNKNVHYLEDDNINQNNNSKINNNIGHQSNSNRTSASNSNSDVSHPLINNDDNNNPISDHQQRYNKIVSTRLRPAVDEMYNRSQKLSLIESICRGLFQHALYILATRPSEVNLRDEKQRTPLMLCAFIADVRWRQSIVRTLLMNINVHLGAVDVDKKTALHHSCEMARAETVDLLLKAGGSYLLNRQDVFGNTPVDYAKSDRLCSRYIVENSPSTSNLLDENNNNNNNNKCGRSLKLRPFSAAPSLYSYQQPNNNYNNNSYKKLFHWNAFESRGKCPTLIDALQFAPVIRDNVDVATVDDGDLPSSTCYYSKETQQLRRSSRPEPTIVTDMKKNYLTTSPIATLLVMHGEQTSVNYRPTAKPNAERDEALFRLLRAALEHHQQQEDALNAKQKTKTLNAKMVARQMLSRHRTGSIASSTGTGTKRLTSEDEAETICSPSSGSTASSMNHINEALLTATATTGSSFITAPPKISLSSNPSSPRPSTTTHHLPVGHAVSSHDPNNN